MTRRAHLDLNTHLLRLMLDLPEGMQITGVAAEQPAGIGAVRLVLEGDDCPEVFDGLPLARVVPIYGRVETGQAHLDRISVWRPETVPTTSEGDE